MTVEGSEELSATYFGTGGEAQPWKNIRGSVKSIEVKGLKGLPQEIFNDFVACTTITLPATLTKIGRSAFWMNSPSKIAKITCAATTAPTLNNANAVFNNTTVQNVLLDIPDAGVGSFGTTDKWKDFNIPQLVITFDANGGEW
jgi:hypothetical protein